MDVSPPPNPPPIVLPVEPDDPNVRLPPPPFPPTVDDVLEARRYREHHDVDFSTTDRLLPERCTANDQYNAILYEHTIIARATAAADPQGIAPPWFEAAIQQLRLEMQNNTRTVIRVIRAEVLPDLKRLMNQRRGDGTIVPYEIVPFANGNDPTEPPYNLPRLQSVDIIENLNGQRLTAYLNGYGVIPLPAGANPHATNRLRKETLKGLIGASG